MPELPCNGWPELCERAYDRVVYPVAHAAMANSASFWKYPAQDQSLRAQLDGSIRGLMLEVHDRGGVPTLCLADCAEGQKPLAADLVNVAGFLADNPREVVTLLIDNRVPAPELAAEFDEAHLTPFLYQPDAEAGWPTLNELIDRGQRLVVFLADATDAPTGYLSLAENVRATNDAAQTAAELDCDTSTGRPDAPLVLLMQTLVQTANHSDGAAGAAADELERPNAELADLVNHDPFLSERVSFCTGVFGREPTFIAVDFQEHSDVIGVTQRVSGLLR